MPDARTDLLVAGAVAAALTRSGQIGTPATLRLIAESLATHLGRAIALLATDRRDLESLLVEMGEATEASARETYESGYRRRV